jgi:hypothetical protein
MKSPSHVIVASQSSYIYNYHVPKYDGMHEHAHKSETKLEVPHIYGEIIQHTVNQKNTKIHRVILLHFFYEIVAHFDVYACVCFCRQCWASKCRGL